MVTVLVLALALAAWLACAAPSAQAETAAGSPPTASPYARWSDAQVATRVHALEQRTSVVGMQLIDAEEQAAAIDRDRTVAQELLAQWVTQSYEGGSSADDMFVAVLAGGRVGTLAERVHAAQVVADYHVGLVEQLDSSAARLQASAIDKVTLVHELATAQAELVNLRSEQARRAALVAEQHAQAQADREAAAQAAARTRAAAAAAAGVPNGALVAYATGGAGATGAGAVGGPGIVNSAFARGGPPTAGLIDAYLASKGSPMAGNGAAFMASAARWQVDPRLVVAISGAESSFGAQTCGPFNAWGWACPNDPADFADWATGIETITRGLRKGYLDEGRTSVALIQQKYAPSKAANDPTGLNNNWVGNVSKFLGELGGNPNVVGPGPAAGANMPNLAPGLIGGD